MRFKRAWFRALVRRRIAVILLLMLQVLFICYVISRETVAAEIIRVLLRIASGFIALHVVFQKDKSAYTGGFIHSKTFVSDDRVASVGTANLDFRSLYLHFECGIWMCDNRAVLQLKQDFLDTVEVSQEISFEDCKASLIKRLFQTILRLFAPLM